MTVDIESIGVGFNTDGLVKGQKALKDTEVASNKTADAADRATKGFSSLDKAASTARQSLGQAAQQTESYIAKLERQNALFGKGATEAMRYDAALLAMTRSQREHVDQLLKTAAANEKVSSSTSNMTGMFKQAAVGLLAIAAAIGVPVALAKGLYEASVQSERLRIGLDYASGGKGVQELAYVTELSNKLGLSLQSTASAYTGLSAAAKGTTLEGAGAKAIFEAVSKASAVMGLSSDQSSGALLALQQMISKGTVQAEELRGQLGERLPGAFQIAARAMGVTTQELGKMLEQGNVIATDFLPKFAAQLQEELGGAAEKAADRLGAATNRMETSIFRLKTALGDSGIAELFAGGMNRSSGLMNQIAGDVEKFNTQGGLRKAAEDVIFLNSRLKMLNNDKFLPGREGMIKDVGAQLEAAKARFRTEDMKVNNLQAPTDNRGNYPGQGSRKVYDAQLEAAQAKSTADVIAIRRKLAGVDEDYLKDLNKLDAAKKNGILTEKEFIEAASELATATYKKSAAGKAETAGMKAGTAATKDHLAEQIQEHKNADKAILDARADFNTQMGFKTRLGQKTNLDAIKEGLDNELNVFTQRTALLQQELDLTKQKKNSLKEQEVIVGKMADLERDYSQAQMKAAGETAVILHQRTIAYQEAEAAARAYVDAVNKQYSRNLDGMGQGSKTRDYNAGMAQIEDKYSQQRQQLESDKRQGAFKDDPARYEEELDRIKRYQNEALESYRRYYDKMTELQGSWQLGAKEGMRNYLDDAANVFKQTESMVGRAFQGMEDALVNFVKTGKLDFKSLAESIITDLIRMQVKAAAVKIFGGGGQEGGGGGGIWGTILNAGISYFTGGAGGLEMGTINNASGEYMNSLEFDGGGYTGNGPRSGGVDGKGGFNAILHPQETVIDHSKGQTTGGGVSVVVYVDASGSSVESDDQGARELGGKVGAMVRNILVEEMMPGGILA